MITEDKHIAYHRWRYSWTILRLNTLAVGEMKG